VWDALLAAGRPFGIEPAGYKAVDSLRLEKGYRYWSTDLTAAENPYEAGLASACAWKRELHRTRGVAPNQAEGARRKLCTIALSAPLPRTRTCMA